MKKTILISFILTVTLSGCHRVWKNLADTSPEIQTLRFNATLDSMNVYSNSGRWDAVVSIAHPEYDTAVKYGNRKHQLFFGVGLAEAYMRMDSVDVAKDIIDRLLPVAEKENDRQALLMIYNTYGIYSLFYNPDYNKAADYFIKAIEYADSTVESDRDNYMRIISNLSHIYNLRADTSGLIYSMQAYRYGKKSGNPFLTYIGAANTATQYLIRQDFSAALSYIEEAMALTEENHLHSDAETYSVYAEAVAGLGDRDKAEHYYIKAMEMSAGVETAIVCGLCCSYGKFLMEDGRWKEAAAIFEKGIGLSVNTKTYMHRDKLYLGLAEACGKMGDVVSELENFKIYHSLSDSIFNAEKERSMKEIWSKYEAEKTKNLLNEKEMQLIRKNRRLYVYAFLIFLLAVIAVVFLLLYRHKRKMYEQLVAIHYGQFQREEKKRESSSADNPIESQSSSNAPDNDTSEKQEDLYKRIEKLMVDEKLYRKEDISLEGLAKQMNTNRSYISAAINHSAGMNFRDYVKTLRINDAVRLLSDENDDTPIKVMYADLGFQSMSSFYSAFQASTGVPPSQYRKEVRRMKKNVFS